jgi:hypothetical protein
MTRKPNISCISELTHDKLKVEFKLKNIVLRRILQLAAPCNYSCILKETVNPRRHNVRIKVVKYNIVENLEYNKEIQCGL